MKKILIMSVVMLLLLGVCIPCMQSKITGVNGQDSLGVNPPNTQTKSDDNALVFAPPQPLSSFYANNPSCWIVLYNIDNESSIEWALWYQQQRNIPNENMLGLHTSTSEHLDTLDEFQDQIMQPVRNYLNANPTIERRIIGFIVGYNVPGHYGIPYENEEEEWFHTGGFSISSELQCPGVVHSIFGMFNYDSPKYIGRTAVLPEARLNRATMANGRYMVARIDGPTIDDAKALTLRAKVIEGSQSLVGHVWYDYTDSAISGSEWYWLKLAAEHTFPNVTTLVAFNADTEQTPLDAFRFGTHDINGWDNNRLRGTPAGPRVLAFNLNSFGAVTVRDIHGGEGFATGVYVPNAIDVGYASSIGATGEPQQGLAPHPDIILSVLVEGWTLGEAFYLGSPYHNWFWEIIGDPFLTMNDLISPVTGDLDHDGDIDDDDFWMFIDTFGLSEGDSGYNPEADYDVDSSITMVDYQIWMDEYYLPNL